MEKKSVGGIQAGNVRKALIKQNSNEKAKPYIIEFLSESTGRAYHRLNNPNGSFTRKNYAGLFKKGPPPVINTSVKENSLAAIPTPTPAPIKATLKRNLKRKVAPPPVPAYAGYFQKQEGLGCGRHALNNLFGRTVFAKGSKTNSYTFPNTTEPISLFAICNTLESTFKRKGIPEKCLLSENYDNNTMVGALDALGYQTEVFNPSDVIDETGDFVGFLVNLGIVSGKPKHWVALKYKSKQPDGTVLYDYFDSLNTRPTEDIPYFVFSSQHPETFIIKVLLPKVSPVNPVDRLAILANATAPLPRKTVAAATPCTTLYDPCTRQPLKDMAALEARVAELKAKQVVKGGTRRKKRRV